MLIFSICVSGRGYTISPIIGVSVRALTAETIWCTDLKYSKEIDLDNISDNFEGQGHRSKVNVMTYHIGKHNFLSVKWVEVIIMSSNVRREYSKGVRMPNNIWGISKRKRTVCWIRTNTVIYFLRSFSYDTEWFETVWKNVISHMNLSSLCNKPVLPIHDPLCPVQCV